MQNNSNIPQKSDYYFEITKRIIKKETNILEYINSIYGSSDDNPEKLECMGNYYFYSDNLSKAVEYYEQSIQLDSNYYSARYHYLIAVKEESEQNYHEAMMYYCSALEIEPTFIDSYVDYGAMLMRAEDYRTAQMLWEDALEIDPTEILLYQNLISLFQLLIGEDQDEYQEKLRSIQYRYEQIFGE